MPRGHEAVPGSGGQEEPRRAGGQSSGLQDLAPPRQQSVAAKRHDRQDQPDRPLRERGQSEGGPEQGGGQPGARRQVGGAGKHREQQGESQGHVGHRRAGDEGVLQAGGQDQGSGEGGSLIEADPASDRADGEQAGEGGAGRPQPGRHLRHPEQAISGEDDPIEEDRFVEPGLAAQGGREPGAAAQHLERRNGIVRLVGIGQAMAAEGDKEQWNGDQRQEKRGSERCPAGGAVRAAWGKRKGTHAAGAVNGSGARSGPSASP